MTLPLTLLDQLINQCCTWVPEMSGGIEVLQCLQFRTQYPEFNVDWWPIHTVSDNMKLAQGNARFFTDTYKGTIQTAQYLYEQKNNPKEQFAVWASAWLHDYRRSMCRAMYKFVPEIEKELFGGEKKYEWHPLSKYAIPRSMSINAYGDSILQIENIHQCIYIISVDMVMSFRSGRVIEVSNPYNTT